MAAGSFIFSALVSWLEIFRRRTFSILGFDDSINERERVLFSNNQRKRLPILRLDEQVEVARELKRIARKSDSTRAAAAKA
jgi:hypothetical protein